MDYGPGRENGAIYIFSVRNGWFKSVDEICPLSLSLLHLLHPRMHLWMIFKFSLLGDLILIGIEQDVNLEVGSDSVPQCCVNLLILGPFQAPIAALSLKYINHPAIILFYAPLYTEGDDFPLISCIITRISVRAPLLPYVCLRTDQGGRLPANVCLFGCFFYLSSLPCPPCLSSFQHRLRPWS